MLIVILYNPYIIDQACEIGRRKELSGAEQSNGEEDEGGIVWEVRAHADFKKHSQFNPIIF